MKCSHCGANLVHITEKGEPLVKNHGIILKADGIALICPKCKGDVSMGHDLAKALQSRLILFLKR